MEKPVPPTLSNSILSLLAYFSVFKHPLTLDELVYYCHFKKSKKEEIANEIDQLIESGIVNRRDGYYYLSDEENYIERRRNGEKLAGIFLKRAVKYSKLISKFPFVRAVLISGSLSKGYMDKHSDIDYFIVTEPKRLWLCRTMLVLFKKIFLLNSRKHFCVNYFIDTDNLQIPDQNIFTATELVFVIPMYNSEVYRKFRSANNWTSHYFPNLNNADRKVAYEFHNHRMRLWIENLFSGDLGEQLDSWCFKRTINFWKKKFKDFDPSTFDMEFRSKKNVSKHHPRGFQKKVLTLYDLKLKSLEKKFDKKISISEPMVMEISQI